MYDQPYGGPPPPSHYQPPHGVPMQPAAYGAPMQPQHAAPASAPAPRGQNPNADRTVFIGNLAWDTTERDLGAFCATQGPVTHVRLVTDPHTGRGRGIAFVEFRDVVAAAAAVRNLSNADFRGRPMRIDFSDPSHRGKKEQLQEAMASGHMPPSAMGGRPGAGGFGGGPMGGMGMSGPPAGFNRAEEREKEELRKVFSTPAPPPPAAAASAPAPQPMQDVHMHTDPRSSPTLPSTIGAHAPTVQPVAQPYGSDTIGKLVTSLTKPQLLEILSEYKKFSAANPDGARQLLFDSPQVASTLLHILIMFGLVRPQDVANIQTMQRPVAGSVPQMTLPGAAPPAAYQPQPAMPPQPAYPPPAAYAPPPPMAYAPPPVSALPPPPVAAPPAPAAGSSVAFTEQDAFMLKEIMKLSPAQIQQLPQEVQDKIRLLQQQLEAQAR